MNRDIQTDFDKLLNYYSQYNLKTIIKDQKFVTNAKTIHRKLYSYLVFMCEAENTNTFKFEIIQKYYNESGSDLILSLFCWSNGAYKPAEFQLRSSIENFIKASLYIEWNDVICCKSVYEIMDYASNSNFFNNIICKTSLSKITNSYSGLCSFVHSSPEKLVSQRSLIQLPQYNIRSSDEFTKDFQNVVNNFLSILYFSYYDLIFSMHNTNRELFLQGLTYKDKAAIYEEKTKNI